MSERCDSCGEVYNPDGSCACVSEGKRSTVDALEAAKSSAENRAELLAEDIEALHMCLDKTGVPRIDKGQVLSMWGRVVLFKNETPNVESNRRDGIAGTSELTAGLGTSTTEEKT